MPQKRGTHNRPISAALLQGWGFLKSSIVRRATMSRSILSLVISLFLTGQVWGAPVAQQIPFTTTTTLTVPDTYTFRFSLWDIATGGTAGANRGWWEIKDIDMTTKTLTTNLGSVTAGVKRSGLLGDLDFSVQYWVQVEKLETDGKTWTVVGKRTKFNIVPYAMWSAQGGIVYQ